MATSTTAGSLKLQCVIDPGMASMPKLKTRIARDVRNSSSTEASIEALQIKDAQYFESIAPDLQTLKTWQNNANGMMGKALSEVKKVTQSSLAQRGLPSDFVAYVDPANPDYAFLTPLDDSGLELHLIRSKDVIADLNSFNKIADASNPLRIGYSKAVDQSAVEFVDAFKVAAGRVAPSEFTETTVKELTPETAPGKSSALKVSDMKMRRTGEAWDHLGDTTQAARVGAKKDLNAELVDRVFEKATQNRSFMDYLKREALDEGWGDSPSGVKKVLARKVRAAIDQWAGTSADMNEWALAMQRAAAERYSMPDALRLLEDGVLKSGYQASSAPRIWREAGKIAEKHRIWFDNFLDAMYENTQETFASQGISEVTVFRGMGRHAMGSTTSRAIPAWVSAGTQDPISKMYVGSRIEEGLRPLSSFSASFNKAKQFSSGIMIGTRVPVQYIIGTARTGFGCLTEQEFVILGNIEGRATVDMASGVGW